MRGRLQLHMSVLPKAHPGRLVLQHAGDGLRAALTVVEAAAHSCWVRESPTASYFAMLQAGW